VTSEKRTKANNKISLFGYRVKTIQNRPDGSGMVAVWVGADLCVCPKRRQATIRTDSGTFLYDER